MSKPEDFGETIAGSRWFKGQPKLTREPLAPVRVHWMCPMEGCGGEMIFNGIRWPTAPMGYHHTCNKCGFTAAVHGQSYPAIEFQKAKQKKGRK